MTLLIFIIVLSVLVLVHELGHFLAAKKAGIKVEEFGLGLPPRLIGKRIGETIYSINALPFGGFVRMAGEDAASKNIPKNRQFIYQKRSIKTVILIAGVIMHLLLAFVCFSVVYSISGIPTLTDHVKIEDILPNSPAKDAGLVSGDIVVSINNQNISLFLRKKK